MIRFAPVYAGLAIVVFILEIIIAFYGEGFVRHTLGDFLATILVYFCFSAILDIRARLSAFFAFVFSASIETAQALDVITAVGAGDSEIVRLVFGTTFSWADMLAYALGACAAYVIDVIWAARRTGHSNAVL